MAKNNQIEVNGIDIKYKKINKTDYISLTDIARYANPKEPKVPIQTWMRNKDVISYLGLWEKSCLHMFSERFNRYLNRVIL